MSRNIPVATAYGVYISQSIHYSSACPSYQDFIFTNDNEYLTTLVPIPVVTYTDCELTPVLSTEKTTGATCGA